MTACETAARTLPDTIADLDLRYLGRKLLEDDACEAERRNGERLWDEERVERALDEYRQFLALMLWHPEAFLVPSEDIDEVWHTHVLHTARYEADCQTIFGRFQHHLPTSDESEDVRDEPLQGRDETLQFFEEAFGEVPQSYTSSGKCGRTADYGKCGRTVDYGKCGRVVSYGRCGRATEYGKCGRTVDYGKCGRASGRCGRAGKCGRK
jgi:hypothetical protein